VTTRNTVLSLSILVVSASGLSAVEPAEVKKGCERCDWKAPKTEKFVTVKTARAISNVVHKAKPGTTVLIEDGTYKLRRTLVITAKGLTLRSKSGDRDKVKLLGKGMTDTSIGVGVVIAASEVCIADLTLGEFGHHGIQVKGEFGIQDCVMHNLRVYDCGQQLLKGSVGKNKKYADDCTVACSEFEYTDSAPSDYTNGVDVLAGKGWIVRDNVLRRIRGPKSGGHACGPAILFWANSMDTVVERNLVVDCYRGIALGLNPGITEYSRDGERRFDHQGGVIRNNVVCNLGAWGDEGIEVNACPNVVVEHNTVFVTGKVPWNISVRFPRSSGIVRNNLTARRVIFRDGAVTKLRSNVRDAKPDWFVDVNDGDLRLARTNLPPIDAATRTKNVAIDFARKKRDVGRAPDVGAFEFRSGGR